MGISVYFAAAFALGSTLINLASLAVAFWRCHSRSPRVDAGFLPSGASSPTPAVSIVRPVCGIEAFSERTLEATFHIDYPKYEIIFCVQSDNDAAIPLLERLIAENPHVAARLLVGDDRISVNPKLNNCIKGWRAARYEWVVLADSNVLAPRDYVQQMQANFTPGVGLVCSPPLGVEPDGFWAWVECAFLNSYQDRWQFCADAFGRGFAQGKSMLWRKDIVENAGGLRVLGRDVAEDAAATKLVRNAGLKVRLVDRPFAQPLGRRTASEVIRRQERWARLRRASFPSVFALEIFSSALLAMLAGGYCAHELGFDWVRVCLIAFAVGAAWHVPEALMARALGWPTAFLSPVLYLSRDLIYPAIWIDAWLGHDFIWQGNSMSTRAKRGSDMDMRPPLGES